jgi:hypothetical protein
MESRKAVDKDTKELVLIIEYPENTSEAVWQQALTVYYNLEYLPKEEVKKVKKPRQVKKKTNN